MGFIQRLAGSWTVQMILGKIFGGKIRNRSLKCGVKLGTRAGNGAEFFSYLLEFSDLLVPRAKLFGFCLLVDLSKNSPALEEIFSSPEIAR